MEMPGQAAVMTLNNATLFPQALLPLHIFEPRYRRMLADALRVERMFTVAMQQADRRRETPCTIAGLGLIRVSVDHEDGTSHLILQGLTRVQLLEPVQLKPYRIHAIRPLTTPPVAPGSLDALVTEIHDLIRQRFNQGALPFPFPFEQPPPPALAEAAADSSSSIAVEDVLKYLKRLSRPEELADLVACALLPDAWQRQVILEAVDIRERLQRLVHFLMEEIRRHKKNASS